MENKKGNKAKLLKQIWNLTIFFLDNKTFMPKYLYLFFLYFFIFFSLMTHSEVIK